MKARIFASIALGAALLLGSTGCSMLAPQATLLPYAPSDGIEVPSSGPLEVRNALIVANADGTDGNLVAAIVNDTDTEQVLLVGLNNVVKAVKVPAGSVVSLGAESTPPLLIEGLNAKPGADVSATFQSGSGTGVEVELPVLDGTLPQYATLVPTPALTPAP